MEDDAIVALYWARNEDAISETDRKYGPYCRTIAWNILKSWEDSEECVSDTWHRAWNAMPPQKPDRLPPFLGRIVRNVSISRWRKGQAQKRGCGVALLLDELEDCLPAPQDVERELEARELTRAVEHWLGRLEREDRLLFLRRYWYGDEVKTLARRRRISPNQAAKRLRRLREGLRRYLEQEGVTV